MRYISDAALTRQLLDEWDIPTLFSTPNLNFSLVEYQPGEYLTAPYTKTERLLFLVRGTVSIRSIRMDGSEYVLRSGDRFTLLGDVEFVTKQPPSFWAQASTPVLALALPLGPYGDKLESDVALWLG